jgi:hypothetical protein
MSRISFRLDRSLAMLLKMSFFGALRKLLRFLVTLPGIALIVVVLLAVYAFIKVSPVSYAVMQQLITDDIYSFKINYGGLVICLLILFSIAQGLTGRGFYYDSSETQFLIASPLKDSQILLYSIIEKLLSGLSVSAILAALVFSNEVRFLEAWLRLYCFLVTIDLIPVAVATSLQRVNPDRAVRLQHSGVLLSLFLFLSMIVLSWLANFNSEFVTQSLRTGSLALVLAPFQWFNLELFSHGRYATALCCLSTASCSILLILYSFRYCDIRNDLFFLNNQKISIQAAEFRKMEFRNFWKWRTLSITVPRLPYLKGAGPILWRRLQEMTRYLPYLFTMMGIELVFVGITQIRFTGEINLFIVNRIQKGVSGVLSQEAVIHKLHRFAVEQALISSQITLILLALLISTLDFRSDQKRIEYLKSLPISPVRVVVAQSFASVLYLCIAFIFTALIDYFAYRFAFPKSEYLKLFFSFFFWMVPLSFVYSLCANTLFLLTPVRGELLQKIRFGFFQLLLVAALLFILGTAMFFTNHEALQISKKWGDSLGAFIFVSTVFYSLLAWVSLQITVWAYQKFSLVD